MAWDVDKVVAEADRAAGKGLRAAAIFLTSRIKELISEPAPRKRVLGKRGKLAGVLYYRATQAATPGAPPRKLSGQLRSSITYEMSADGKSARVGTNKVYARRLEQGGHPFLSTALERWRNELGRIVEGGAK